MELKTIVLFWFILFLASCNCHLGVDDFVSNMDKLESIRKYAEVNKDITSIDEYKASIPNDEKTLLGDIEFLEKELYLFGIRTYKTHIEFGFGKDPKVKPSDPCSSYYLLYVQPKMKQFVLEPDQFPRYFEMFKDTTHIDAHWVLIEQWADN